MKPPLLSPALIVSVKSGEKFRYIAGILLVFAPPNVYKERKGISMKVWLDDVRKAPDSWVHVKKASEAIKLLESDWDLIEEISFDHDLGNDEEGTGYKVLCHIEKVVKLQGRKPPIMHIHSANPVGVRKMLQAIKVINSGI